MISINSVLKCKEGIKTPRRSRHRPFKIAHDLQGSPYSKTRINKYPPDKMRFVIFALFVIATMAMAAPQGEKVATCSPLFGYCQITDNCCRYLICSSYQAKCIPKGGLIIPGQDTRPLGPGPYPPNVPLD